MADLLAAITKLPADQITGSVLLNQKRTSQMLENRQRQKMILRAFFNRLHGCHVHPENIKA